MELKILINFCYLILFNFVKCEETQCVLNGKKSLNFVSDKFISFTVDPATLFTGLNISETSRELGKYMTPAYVRIAGVSTSYLHFSEDEEEYQPDLPENVACLTYTPSFWDSLNDWFSHTNLSMIFALNDKEKLEEKWNSKNIFPLLQLTSQLDMECSWQLGYDSAGQNFEDYREALMGLRHILDAFPDKKSKWKVITNELDNWLKGETPENIRRYISSFQNSSYATMWQGASDEEEFPMRDEMARALSSPISPVLPTWTTIPKSKRPVTFASCLLLAKQLGDGAKLGYDVIFREPRLYELITDTPNFWFIVFHKTLMGRNVLDIKSTFQQPDTHIFGHCSRKQNSFSRRGAITILVVNNGSYEHTTSLKLPLANPLNTKHIEVQSYVLTSDTENSTNVYSNDQKLTMDLLKENLVFSPKLRRARVSKHLTLTVPPKSIGFFVLPDARIPICINDEDETNLIIEEIHKAQTADVFTTTPTELKPRINDQNTTTLNELYTMMKKELETDEKYYHDKSIPLNFLSRTKAMQDDNKKPNDSSKQFSVKSINNDDKIEVLKIGDFGKTREEIMEKLSEQSQKIRERHFKLMKTKQDNFDDVTSREIEEAVLKVTRMLKDKPNGNKVKRQVFPRRLNSRKSRLSSLKRPDSPILRKLRQRNGLKQLRRERVGQAQQFDGARMKRDINMDLLMKKLDKSKGAQKETLQEKIQKLREKSKKAKKAVGEDEEKEEEEAAKPKTLQELLKPKPLDLSKLLHLRMKDEDESQEKEPEIEAEEKSAKDQSMEEEYFDDPGVEDEYSDDFDQSFRDDLENFKGFYEKFGDDVKVANPIFTRSRSGVETDEDDDEKSLWNKEFVINHEDDELIQKTIKNLEDYFNQSKTSNEAILDNQDEDIDYEDEHPRAKREEKHFTEEDILHYKQLMNTNIRHMRDNIRKQKLKLKPIKLTPRKDHQVTLVQRMHRLKEAVEKAQRSSPPQVTLPIINTEKLSNILRKPKIDLDKFKALNNAKFLKSRLAQHKITQTENKLSQNGEIDDETKNLITLIKSELRNRRQRSIRPYEEKYVPQVELGFIRKPYVPKFRSKEQRSSSRSKRYIRGFNDKIDDSLNSIIDDGKYLVPKFSKSSDFTLVLPTKDEITLVNSENSSEIKFKHLLSTEEHDASTCPLHTTTEALANREATEQSYSNDTFVRNGDGHNSSTIEVKYHDHETNGNVIDKFFKSVTDFIANMENKVKTYLKVMDD